MIKSENIIIGAGPAGLAVAGRFSKKNIPYILIEQSANVGHSWRKHYDRLHLHTVKQYSALPHLPFSEDYPTYLSRDQLVSYMEDYAAHFDIQPKFGVSVTDISRFEDAAWKVSTDQGIFIANNVIIATGINRIPNVPSWPGQNSFTGKMMHSRDYKNAQPFLNKIVLVVGMGNTGAELALDLSEHDVETYISVRNEINVVPRDLNGRPVQVTSKQLAKLPFGIGDWLGSQIRKIYFGDLSRYGLTSSKMSPAVQLRETGKTPIVDIGTIAAIKKGKIKVIGDIDALDANGVIQKNGTKLEVDAIILATGFKPAIGDFLQVGQDLFDNYDCPKSPVGNGEHAGLYFVGYDNYKLGGILGTIKDDSATICNAIANKVKAN